MPLHQAAGDARGRRALAGRDDDAHAVVPAAAHRAAAGVHHETDEETAKGGKKQKREGRKKTRMSESLWDQGSKPVAVYPPSTDMSANYPLLPGKAPTIFPAIHSVLSTFNSGKHLEVYGKTARERN